jgi:hypothetical protein
VRDQIIDAGGLTQRAQDEIDHLLESIDAAAEGGIEVINRWR